VTATSRTTLLFLVVLFASGCGGGFALPAAEREAYRKAFDETLIEREPLCIEAGPFPYRSGTQPDPWRGIGCDKCQQLEAAGFLVRRIDDAGVTYDLSDAGRPLYRRAPTRTRPPRRSPTCATGRGSTSPRGCASRAPGAVPVQAASGPLPGPARRARARLRANARGSARND
jgi:hypothetical protein